ncbi:MAG UNVERIFIED_CONTAM: hypothetical protein LVT10_06965 [Anaerolineae bacterium]|jgi:hypothetical protein
MPEKLAQARCRPGEPGEACASFSTASIVVTAARRIEPCRLSAAVLQKKKKKKKKKTRKG